MPADLKLPSDEVYPIIARLEAASHCRGRAEYERMHEDSIKNNSDFWGRFGKSEVDWFQPFDQVKQGSFEEGNISWYMNGKLNASYNCLDRHAKTRPEALAVIWEGNETTDIRRITYREALAETCKIANALKRQGVKKGDKVCLYMPMVPEAAFAMLACARIGAPHIVVFAGFSAQSLRDRIVDSGATVVITADEGVRGKKFIPLKKTVDEALGMCPAVKTCFVYRRTGRKVSWVEGRDIWLQEAMEQERSYCVPEIMDSEDLLFMLHTSGSTGKPKGLAHATGGYLVYAALTHKYVFDYRPGDVYACVADIGWITGHSYIVYGPLCNGATTFMFEGLPNQPGPDRYWDMVARHKINQFYTAPTALRALMTAGDEPTKKHDLSSLRVLGSVGEPINPEAWKWYYNNIGKGQCSIVDTYWQTETGGIVLTPLPGSVMLKPGAGSRPFFGIELAVLTEKGEELQGNNVTGGLAIKTPWPGMARTIFGDHKRYRDVYLSTFKGYYFTGDRCIRDKDGWYWVTGRMDDVMNVSGHRIGSAEVESALVEHPLIAEAAVIGIAHEIKGQGLVAYVSPTKGVTTSPKLIGELNKLVKASIGSFAQPEMIIVSADLPKTRSGKIMRRLLRKIATLETNDFGDIQTLADPSVVDRLVTMVREFKAAKQAKL